MYVFNYDLRLKCYRTTIKAIFLKENIKSSYFKNSWLVYKYQNFLVYQIQVCVVPGKI